MQNIFVITHANDLDGICSAALVRMKYGTSTDNIFFTDYSDARVRYAFGRVSKLAKSMDSVFITDFAAEKYHERYFMKVIGTLRRRGVNVIWLDHHPWPKSAERIAKLCNLAVFGESSMCATDIAAKIMDLNEPGVSQMVAIVHRADFAIYARDKAENMLTEKYGTLIVYYDMFGAAKMNMGLRRLVAFVCKDKLVHVFDNKLADRLELESDRNIAACLKQVKYAGKGIAVAFISGKHFLNKQNALMRMKNKRKNSIVMLVDTDTGKGSIRNRKNSGKDISKLAAALGGGGHPHAAGFTLKKDYRLKTEHGRKSLLKEIEDAAKSLRLC